MTKSSNSVGDALETPSTLANVWAKATELKGKELIEAKQIVADCDTSFEIRHSATVANINSQFTILWKSKTYKILETIKTPSNRPETIKILAKRRND
jgi:SPP1 family predicted phage head-tail adaptor